MKTYKLLASFAPALALVLSGCAVAERPAPAPAALQAEAPAAAWPHEASDLRADPNVRFGVLENGMRYAIMRNATPVNNASLRLRIDAGSLHEDEGQRGLAHFIEHMTLNETANVPEGEMIRILERHGLQFGPDTNAFTSFEQTVYMLDLPRTSDDTVDTALFLMREVAGEATMRTEAIDRERGVILSEERTRATPPYRMVVNELGFLFRDDLLPERLPIGLTEVIANAPRERFVEFYEGYYRPERATLIAVGDFDVDELEEKIRARFSDWRGRGTPAQDPPAPNLPERDFETRLFVEPGVPGRLTLNWVAPLDERPDSRERRIDRLTEHLGLAIIGRRLERLTATTAPHLLGSAVTRQRQGLRGEVVQVIGVTEPANWRDALQTLEQEQRRAVEHGFSEVELQREIGDIRGRLTSQMTGAATRPSPNLSMGLVNAVNEDQVFLSPADELALFEEVVKGLTAEQVHAAMRRLFEASGPLLFVSSPTEIEGGERVLAAEFTQSRLTPVSAPDARQAQAWPYEDFGTVGQVVEQRAIEGTGATAVRFDNGVRLTVRPSDFKDDEIIVQVRYGGGTLAFPTDRPSPAIGLLAGGFTGGGLGQLTFEEIGEVLSGRVYALNTGIQEDSFIFSGRTRPEDFALQLQLLAAYARDPAWRPTAWDRIRGFSSTLHDQFETSPSGIYRRDSSALLRGGDRRFATPSREEMAAMPIDALRSVLAETIASGPLEVVITGDVSVEEAVRQTAATFGALPRRDQPAAVPGPPVRFPAAAIERRTHRGRDDQGLAFIAWPTDDFFSDQRRARALNLLAAIMQLRLIEEIREQQGAAYSPNASHQPSENVPGYGFLSAVVEVRPEGVDQFLADAQQIAADLAARPVDSDELERARRPLVERIQRQRTSSNEWWAQHLGGIQERPERAESIRVGLDQYAEITPAELQQLARQYLRSDRAWRMTVKPAGN
jgi:zinc protease